MGPEGALKCSQESATGPCPEPHQCNSHPQKQILQLGLPGLSFLRISLRSYAHTTCTAHPILLDFIILMISGGAATNYEPPHYHTSPTC
jgi:hypothetical protein